MANEERDTWMKNLPSGSELGTVTARSRIKQNLDLLNNAERNLQRYYGVRPGYTDHYDVDERGKPRPSAVFIDKSQPLQQRAVDRAVRAAGRDR